MAEYIDRQAAISILNAKSDMAVGTPKQCFAAAAAMLEKLPAADVEEVVRCMDCRHFTEGMAIGMCKRNPDNPIIPMPYNNYSGFGERRNT